MKNALLVISLLSFIVIVSCNKEDNQPGNQSNSNNTLPAGVIGIPPFSGKWTGTINVDEINSNLFQFYGDPITTKQEWVVNPDSSLTIIDTVFDYNSQYPSATQTWKGRLYKKDSLFVTLTKNSNCFGTNQPMTIQLKTKIIKTPDNKYTITSKVDYPMCPPDCLFAFNYLIKKQG